MQLFVPAALSNDRNSTNQRDDDSPSLYEALREIYAAHHRSPRSRGMEKRKLANPSDELESFLETWSGQGPASASGFRKAAPRSVRRLRATIVCNSYDNTTIKTERNQKKEKRKTKRKNKKTVRVTEVQTKGKQQVKVKR